MGILLVYDVTDDASFNNIRNWMKNIEQHAEDKVVKVCLFDCLPVCDRTCATQQLEQLSTYTRRCLWATSATWMKAKEWCHTVEAKL